MVFGNITSRAYGFFFFFLFSKFLLWSFCARSVVCQINENADPWVLDYGTTVGPDGPWNALIQAVNFPHQYLTMLPSLTESNLFIESSACSSTDAACPLPSSTLWNQTAAHSLFNGVNSTVFDASSWDPMVEPLRLEGSGILSTDRIELNSGSRSTGFVDGNAVTMTSNFTVNFPSSSVSYTMDFALLSLYVGSENVTWTSENGSSVTYGHFLEISYLFGDIPSISYGLHIGSVEPEVPGSLVIGGYDRSLVLTAPITSDGQEFTLVDIGIQVVQGGSPFDNMSDSSGGGFLQSDGKPLESIDVIPNPGVPYMYLPGDTCAATAEYLPVSFDDGLGLYIWNTTDAAYSNIVSSVAALYFTFGTTAGSSNISVPFALLNLTLDHPLASSQVQYFPCSPYTPSSSEGYHLGRAFLQAAFLGQNWQTSKAFLAQAPGPSTGVQDIKNIASTDATLKAMVAPPNWYTTWTSVLTTLPGSTNNSTASHTPSNKSGLSSGAIAGIVVGVIAAIAIVGLCLFFCLRRRKRTSPVDPTIEVKEHQSEAMTSEPGGTAQTLSESASAPVYEKDTSAKPPAELNAQAPVSELQGNEGYHQRYRWDA